MAAARDSSRVAAESCKSSHRHNAKGKHRHGSWLLLHARGFTPAITTRRFAPLEAAGAGSPPGRLYHAALESDGLIQVFDVWESQESFEAFGGTLLPIMGELGVDPGQPMVAPVRNTIQG